VAAILLSACSNLIFLSRGRSPPISKRKYLCICARPGSIFDSLALTHTLAHNRPAIYLCVLWVYLSAALCVWRLMASSKLPAGLYTGVYLLCKPSSGFLPRTPSEVIIASCAARPLSRPGKNANLHRQRKMILCSRCFIIQIRARHRAGRYPTARKIGRKAPSS
jgi:hypothetical protein